MERDAWASEHLPRMACAHGGTHLRVYTILQQRQADAQCMSVQTAVQDFADLVCAVQALQRSAGVHQLRARAAGK